MKIKEILVDSKISTISRFTRSEKTAMLDGHLEYPKKILNMINQSLKATMGYKFKMTPMHIEKEEYWATFKYELGEYAIEVNLQVSWFDGDSSIDKPIIIAWVNTYAGTKDLFRFRYEITTEMINTIWNEVSDDIHIAANPSKRWSEIK